MKVQNRQQVLLFITVAAVALLAADYLVLTPMQNGWKARSQRISELRAKVASGKGLLDREQALRSRWSMMTSNTFPRDFSSGEQELLQAFDRWSRESRITILSINPQRKREAEDYVTLQCQVEALGDLGTVTSFLYNLEKDTKGIRVEAFELAARDTSGSQMALNLQVSGLVLAKEDRR